MTYVLSAMFISAVWSCLIKTDEENDVVWQQIVNIIEETN